MGKECHRCGSQLAPQGVYCFTCGAPQLRYQADAEAPGDSTGQRAVARGIQWKHAIGAAVTFAVPVGFLCSSIVPALSDACCLWVVAGSIGAVGLYQRRSATNVLARPVGVRIGSLSGVLAAAIAAAGNAGAMLFERYVRHGGDSMERAFQQSMEQGSKLAGQIYSASPVQAEEAMRFWISPDGRAAATLLTALMTALGITVFAMIGGALGSRIFSGRNSSLQNT